MGCKSSKIQPLERTPSGTILVPVKPVDIAQFHYEPPVKRELAVCFVYFNVARSKRILMNYLYVTNKLRISNIPFFTLELVYDQPEISDAIHICGTTAIFHKEQLCHLLETHVPPEYTKLLFLDADILFANPHWYSRVSDLLDTYQVVQPFRDAVFLDLTYTKQMIKKPSVLFMDRHQYDSKFHPGFGWGFQRAWFRKVGFYQYAISGCGDTFSVSAWLRAPLPSTYPFQEAYRSSYNEYKQYPPPTMTFCEGIIYHLWHGSMDNRQWKSRHAIIDGISDVRSILKIEPGKPFELTDATIDQKFRDYFTNRDDDGLK
jgi:hypothetical protein